MPKQWNWFNLTCVAQSWYMQACFSFSRFFFMDYRWLVNTEVTQKKKTQCETAAGSARRSIGMLLVFDIPPSLSVVSLSLSNTHTLLCTMMFFFFLVFKHIYSFVLLMINLQIVWTLHCTVPFHLQQVQPLMHVMHKWSSTWQDGVSLTLTPWMRC